MKFYTDSIPGEEKDKTVDNVGVSFIEYRGEKKVAGLSPAEQDFVDWFYNRMEDASGVTDTKELKEVESENNYIENPCAEVSLDGWNSYRNKTYTDNKTMTKYKEVTVTYLESLEDGSRVELTEELKNNLEISYE